MAIRKYRNKPVTNAFGRFDSLKEWRRYVLLLDAQKRGEIKNLQRQVKFNLVPVQRDENGKLLERAVDYYADFSYEKDGKLIVEDVKSEICNTIATFKIKKKLMLYVHKIRIKIV